MTAGRFRSAVMNDRLGTIGKLRGRVLGTAISVYCASYIEKSGLKFPKFLLIRTSLPHIGLFPFPACPGDEMYYVLPQRRNSAARPTSIGRTLWIIRFALK